MRARLFLERFVASLSAATRWESAGLATTREGGVFIAAVIVAALLSLLVAAEFASSLANFPADRDAASVAEDLVAFHRAGEMALEGDASESYDPKALRSGLAAHQQGLLWLNPPHAFLLIAPFAALPYGAAKAIWLALTVAAFVLMLRLANVRGPAAYAAAFLSPAMLIAAMLLQLGAFIAAGLAAALVLAPRRPLLAGVLLALLTMKPQYGLVAPVFLIATGQWRAIVAAVAATAALVVASVAAFGADTWAAFFESLKTVHEPFSRQLLEGTATFGQTAGKLGAEEALRTAVQIAGIGVCAILTWFAARRLDRAGAIGLTLLASLAAAPSAWIYDWPFVVAGLAFLFPVGRAALLPSPVLHGRGAGGEGPSIDSAALADGPSPLTPLPQERERGTQRPSRTCSAHSSTDQCNGPLPSRILHGRGAGGEGSSIESASLAEGPSPLTPLPQAGEGDRALFARVQRSAATGWPLSLQAAAAFAWLAPLAPTLADNAFSGLAAPVALYALVLAAAAALFGRFIGARPQAPSSA